MSHRPLIALCTATLCLAAATAALADGYGRGIYDGSPGSMTSTMGAMAAPKTVGGAPMLPTRDIIDNAMRSHDHTTLVTAVKAAGLVDTLKMKGPYTVFAPTDSAFAALPAGTVDTLLKPENKAMLTQVLTYHVVPGRIDAATLAQQIRAGGGKATLKTANGATLTAAMRGADVVIWDAKGHAATVTTTDVYQSNGVIHVVDTVLMPAS
jgi:uncharacterized surface protein with fasciclin (FAS1) repeats